MKSISPKLELHDSLHDEPTAPPQAVESEQSLLGCLLIDPTCLSLLNGLTSNDFYDSRHQLICRAINDLFRKKLPVDIVTVAQRLKDRSELASAGGRSYLTDLLLAAVSTAHVPYYAKIILEKSIMRRLIKAGHLIAAIGYSGCDLQSSIRKAKAILSFAVSKAPSS
jgi:replicative DNA helicase